MLAHLSGDITASLYPDKEYELQILEDVILTSTCDVASVVSGRINKKLEVLLKLQNTEGSQLDEQCTLGMQDTYLFVSWIQSSPALEVLSSTFSVLIRRGVYLSVRSRALLI